MQLRFYANMRTVIGVPALEVEDEGIDTFRKLIAFLVERYPESTYHLLDENHDLRQDAAVFVNGRNPRLSKDGIDTPLPRDAVVSFFSPISSGRMTVEGLRGPNFARRNET